tara:strand:- start:58 stop:525 length:468 start_codon:yes stop_codon:yes gene_type:complete
MDTNLGPDKQIKIFCGQEYNIPSSVAQTSILLKNIIADCCYIGGEEEISPPPIPVSEQHVHPEVISKIIEYMEYIVNNPVLPETNKSGSHFTKFETQYFQNMTNDELFRITAASNYLDIPQLLDVCSSRISEIIMECKNPKEIREVLRIRQDMDE